MIDRGDLAAWLVKPARRALDWLQARLRSRNTVITPAAGSLNSTSIPPQLAPPTMPAALTMAESMEAPPLPFTNNSMWAQWEGLHKRNAATLMAAMGFMMPRNVALLSEGANQRQFAGEMAAITFSQNPRNAALLSAS